MPTKQTRESIEAELSVSAVERAVTRLRETLRNIEEFERWLQKEEKERGIFSVRDTPVVERMAALGMTQAAIDCVADVLLHQYALHRASADAERLADLQYARAALVEAQNALTGTPLRVILEQLCIAPPIGPAAQARQIIPGSAVQGSGISPKLARRR